MANASANAAPDRFEVRATASDHFAWLRTRLSIERTLMSWVRTAVSLIGFGFAIVQFFDRMATLPGAVSAPLPDAPRYLGLMLIGCGIAALIVSVWQYHYGLNYLWSKGFESVAGIESERRQTPLLAVCIALIFIGLFAFFAVLFRIS